MKNTFPPHGIPTPGAADVVPLRVAISNGLVTTIGTPPAGALLGAIGMSVAGWTSGNMELSGGGLGVIAAVLPLSLGGIYPMTMLEELDGTPLLATLSGLTTPAGTGWVWAVYYVPK